MYDLFQSQTLGLLQQNLAYSSAFLNKKKPLTKKKNHTKIKKKSIPTFSTSNYQNIVFFKPTIESYKEKDKSIIEKE